MYQPEQSYLRQCCKIITNGSGSKPPAVSNHADAHYQ